MTSLVRVCLTSSYVASGRACCSAPGWPHLAPPSRARRCPTAGRPGPLRSSELPWGLPGLTDKDQARLDNGNAIMRATLNFLRCCVRCKVPFILENPQSSILWWLPEVLELAAVPQAQFVVTHFCQWGTPWKKATKFLCFRCPTAEANLNRLCHARGCICSRTQQPHVVLSGANKRSSGQG